MEIGKLGITDLRRKMNAIRQSGIRVKTNYFNQCAGTKENFDYWFLPGAIAFLWNDLGIKRIYFYAVNLDSLGKVLACCGKGSCLDYITKDKNDLSDIFLTAGFNNYKEYQRFHVDFDKENEKFKNSKRKMEKMFLTYPYGEMAKIEDAEIIDTQLREEFDPYEAHFYSIEQLKEFIQKGWVWVAKENEKIVAANIFEIQGCKSYGAYMYNRGDLILLPVLLAKSNKYKSEHFKTNYHYCWMRLDNKKALKYNIEFGGMVSDNLYDIIYVKE